MSYGKRDEDAEQSVVKVDRTSVFQEGVSKAQAKHNIQSLTDVFSSSVQHLAHIASKVPYPSHKDCSPAFHWREIPTQ